MLYKVLFLLTVFLLLTACASPPSKAAPTPGSSYPNPNSYPPPTGVVGPSPEPYATEQGDETLTRGPVEIKSQEIVVLESNPPQDRLQVTGSLPTPCHKLRAIVNPPDPKNGQNQIQVEIYSLVDPNVVCIQIVKPFETSILLGSFTSGSYTVFVNGEKVGEIKP